jgi:plasmid maintenance system antidote protein VapI
VTDDLPETLRELLRAAVKDSGRKQTWIADQLHVSAKHLSQMLTGRVDLTLGWAQRIAVLCDHRIDISVVSLPSAADLQRRLAELQPEIDRLAALGAVAAVTPSGEHERGEAPQ